MSELDDALKLADRVLDKPYIDPDGDICMLARQLIRQTEILARQSAPQQEPIGFMREEANSEAPFLENEIPLHLYKKAGSVYSKPVYAAPHAAPDVRFVGGIAPSHWCKVCGALWRQWGDGSWNLRSRECGKCCDTVAMAEQIDIMGAPTLASDYTAPPQPDAKPFAWCAMVGGEYLFCLDRDHKPEDPGFALYAELSWVRPSQPDLVRDALLSVPIPCQAHVGKTQHFVAQAQAVSTYCPFCREEDAMQQSAQGEK